MDISLIFSSPAVTASFAAAIAYIIATAFRQWVSLPPIAVAVVVATILFAIGQFATPAQQGVVVDLLGIIVATLAAMGFSLTTEKIGENLHPTSTMGTLEYTPKWWRSW